MRDAMEAAEKAGRFKKDPWESIDLVELIIERHRVRGFPFCEYDKSAICCDLRRFIKNNENSKSEKLRKAVDRAKVELGCYEEFEFDPPLQRRGF